MLLQLLRVIRDPKRLELSSSFYLYATKSSHKDASSLVSLAGDIRLNFLLTPRNVEKYPTSASTTSFQAIPLYSSRKWDSTQTSLTREFYYITRTENSNSTVDTHSYITKREFTTRSITKRGQSDCSSSTEETTSNALIFPQARQNLSLPRERQEYLGSNASYRVDREALHHDHHLSQPDHLRQAKRRTSIYLHCSSSNNSPNRRKKPPRPHLRHLR